MMAKCTAIRAQANGKPGAVGWVLRRFWCIPGHFWDAAHALPVADSVATSSKLFNHFYFPST